MKSLSVLMLALILSSSLSLVCNIQPVKSDYVWTETIYIRADGSIEPHGAPVSTVDNVTYTLTDSIIEPIPDHFSAIIVERDNTVLDGAGCTLQGSNTRDSRGIDLSGRSNVTIKNMEITAYSFGIWLNSSSGNTVSGNNVTANFLCGVGLDSSSGNTVSGNVFANDGLGIFSICGNICGNVVSDNIVNGEPLVYLEEMSDCVVEDAGQVILVKCNNVTVENLNLSNTALGVELLGTNNTTISGNNIIANNAVGIYLVSSNCNTVSGNNISEANEAGVYVEYSSNNSIFGNSIEASRMGIMLASSFSNSVSGNNVADCTHDGIVVYWDSSCNTISRNSITKPGGHAISILEGNENLVENNHEESASEGIWLYRAFNNTVVGNDIANNRWDGIDICDSSGNRFFHNNLIGNPQQVHSQDSANVWDDGFPSGGNLWSDYNGTDVYNGPSQNVTGSDGIGDTPYVIDSNNRDSYPLMGSFSSLPLDDCQSSVSCISNSTVSGFSSSESTIAFDVSGETGTSGFCTVTILHSIASPPYTVKVDDTPVLYTTLYENETLSTIYFTYEHSTHQVTIAGKVVITITGDVNGDGVVDVYDLIIVALAYGSTPIDPNWKPNADINGDKTVDIYDLILVASHYGETTP